MFRKNEKNAKIAFFEEKIENFRIFLIFSRKNVYFSLKKRLFKKVRKREKTNS